MAFCDEINETGICSWFVAVMTGMYGQDCAEAGFDDGGDADNELLPAAGDDRRFAA